MAPKQRPPPPSDLDVYRSAHLWVQRHGDAATSKAREMVEAMRKEGDEDGVDVWLRIIVAIGALAELRRRVSQGHARKDRRWTSNQSNR